MNTEVLLDSKYINHFIWRSSQFLNGTVSIQVHSSTLTFKAWYSHSNYPYLCNLLCSVFSVGAFCKGPRLYISKWLLWKKNSTKRCIRGVTVSAFAFWTEDCVFEPGTGSHYSRRKLCIVQHLTSPFWNGPLNRKLSVKWNPLSNDRFERTNAGSRAPMVLNYSRCVVLGSGPA